MTKKNANTALFDEELEYNKAQSLVEWIDEWSFKSANTATYTHKIHRYPAMFSPQLVRKVVEAYTQEGDIVLDIFNGSGSTMVECCLLNRNSIGIEINPLANLIAKVKTTAIDSDDLDKHFGVIENQFLTTKVKYDVLEFKNIDFWFENSAKQCISKLLHLIAQLENEDERNFFNITLSEIVREVSTCKHSGFKMHRDVAKVGKIIGEEEFFEKYKKTYHKNLKAIEAFTNKVKQLKYKKIQLEGSSTQLQKSIKADSVDLILTSPPYGVSHNISKDE